MHHFMPGRMGRACLAVWFLLGICAAAMARPKDANELLARGREVAFTQGPRAALPLLKQALPQFRAAHDRHGEAVTLGYMGYCYEELADYSEALVLLNQSLNLKKQLGDSREVAKTLNIFGLVYWHMGNYSEAVRRLDKSLETARELHYYKLEGAVLNNLGLVSDEIGDYARSLDYFHRALEADRKGHFERGESDVLGNLGGDYELLGQYQDALRYYEQARELDESRKFKPDLSEDLINLGLCRLGLGEPRQAIGEFDQTVVLTRQIGLKRIEADAHKGKGSALLELGEYDAARNELNQAIQAYEQSGSKQELTEALNDDGSLHALLGDTATAESDFHRAIDLSRSLNSPRQVANNLIALADLDGRRQRYDQAEVLDQQAYAWAERVKDQALMASSLLQLALNLQQQGRLGEARAKARQALAIGRVTAAAPVEAEAHYRLAELDRRAGRLHEAISGYAAGEIFARKSEDTDVSWRLAFGKGQALEDLNRDREALEAYRQAVEIIESVRNRLREERFQSGYIQDRYQVYVALIHLLLKMGQDGEAFFYSEKLRALSYLDIVRDSLPPATYKDAEALRYQIKQLQRALDKRKAEADAPGSRQAVEAVSTRLRAAERMYQSKLDDLRSTHPLTAALNGLLVASTNQIQSRLPVSAALIEYLVGKDGVTMFVVRRNSLHATTIPVKASNLRAKVELFRDLVMNPQSRDWRMPAESLESLLIEPMAKPGWLAGITMVYVIPNSVLYYLPFAALPRQVRGGYRYLIQDYQIAYLPAATALVYGEARKDPPGNLFALAPAEAGLRYAQQEVQNLAELYPKRSLILEGSSATKDAFERQAIRFQIIHLAAHGFFDKLNPMFSGVQLEPDGKDDGRLEVHDILSLRLNASLVTLSSCETALGSGYFSEFPAGDDFVGLTRAFMTAGSSSVLASLWEVNDRATSKFMTDFYAALRQSSEVTALRNAQLDFIRSGGPHSQPYFWAPFILMRAKN